MRKRRLKNVAVTMSESLSTFCHLCDLELFASESQTFGPFIFSGGRNHEDRCALKQPEELHRFWIIFRPPKSIPSGSTKCCCGPVDRTNWLFTLDTLLSRVWSSFVFVMVTLILTKAVPNQSYCLPKGLSHIGYYNATSWKANGRGQYVGCRGEGWAPSHAAQTNGAA